MTTAPKPKPKAKAEEREPDTFGVGQLADGSLNIVTPTEYAKRVAERNAEEALWESDREEEAE